MVSNLKIKEKGQIFFFFLNFFSFLFYSLKKKANKKINFELEKKTSKMLTLNKNMKQAIQTFNKLSPDKASIILSRIFSSPTSDTLTLFSEKEKSKLLKLIKIYEPELQNMLRAFSFLLMHAVAEKN